MPDPSTERSTTDPATATDALGAAFAEIEQTMGGALAVRASRLDGSDPVTYHESDVAPAASTIKVFLLGALLDDVASGRTTLDHEVVLGHDDQVTGSGVLKSLQPTRPYTLHDLATLMIIVSDNTAANMTIELLGADRVRAWIHGAGMAGTELVGKLQLPHETQSERQRGGALNRTCAADVAGLFLALERGELLPPRAADRMRAILSAQIYTEGIGRSLPIDPEVPDAHGRTARVETKSGCLAGVWHDAGIVRRRDGAALFALAVLTADSDDRAERWEQEGLLTIGRIARLAFEAATAEEVPPGA